MRELVKYAGESRHPLVPLRVHLRMNECTVNSRFSSRRSHKSNVRIINIKLIACTCVNAGRFSNKYLLCASGFLLVNTKFET